MGDFFSVFGAGLQNSAECPIPGPAPGAGGRRKRRRRPKGGAFPRLFAKSREEKKTADRSFSLRPAGSAAPGGVRRGRSLHKLLDGTVELVNGSPVLGAHGVHNAVLQVVLEDDLARIVQGAAHR